VAGQGLVTLLLADRITGPNQTRPEAPEALVARPDSPVHNHRDGRVALTERLAFHERGLRGLLLQPAALDVLDEVVALARLSLANSLLLLLLRGFALSAQDLAGQSLGLRQSEPGQRFFAAEGPCQSDVVVDRAALPNEDQAGQAKPVPLAVRRVVAQGFEFEPEAVRGDQEFNRPPAKLPVKALDALEALIQRRFDWEWPAETGTRCQVRCLFGHDGVLSPVCACARSNPVPLLSSVCAPLADSANRSKKMERRQVSVRETPAKGRREHVWPTPLARGVGPKTVVPTENLAVLSRHNSFDARASIRLSTGPRLDPSGVGHLLLKVQHTGFTPRLSGGK
jgi:hypothetical protein